MLEFILREERAEVEFVQVFEQNSVRLRYIGHGEGTKPGYPWRLEQIATPSTCGLSSVRASPYIGELVELQRTLHRHVATEVGELHLDQFARVQ
jgi:hypothetical protein